MSKTGGFDTPELESFVLNKIASELALDLQGVRAVVSLLNEGATVPFIARYRKEATGGLDEVQIRSIEERKTYLLELEDRRKAILKSIEDQGKLTEELEKKIRAATTKTELEDLYLPYKPKRRTKAAIAREMGLEPLAQRILEQPLEGDPLEEGRVFVDPEKKIETAADALKWAGEIVVETIVEDADVRSLLRKVMWEEGMLRTRLVEKKADKKAEAKSWDEESKIGGGDARTKYEDYYDYEEQVLRIPSHRYLAVRRGENEEVLKCSVEIDAESFKTRVEMKFELNPASPFAGELQSAVDAAVKRRLVPSVETDVRVDLKERSDLAAVDVFAENLENLLLAAPFGGRPVVGIDPGLRTGCKCAAVDDTGKYLDNITIYPARGDDAAAKSKIMLAGFFTKHRPAAVAVGNGTGGREAERLVREVLRENEELRNILVVSVSEAGASVYSASDIARKEFPDLDLTVRGAVSIARRLQDPLAELVKIDPKSIGVGQYQHDVHQPLLQTKLHQVVESCVNRVGVELNTASSSLLSYVAGVGPSMADRIVEHREAAGAFKSRKALMKVKGLGPKTYEQAAGFLRVYESDHPLDRSAVHPERYVLVETMARDLGVPLTDLVGNAESASKIPIENYVGNGVGEPTLKDIIAELSKPGRDPRKSFEAPSFREDVNELEDLSPGMVIDGVVTNVTAFGAFVDVGVHQDGLVHVSQLADRFVKNPGDVVKVGDILKVKVLDVDPERRRISLTARMDVSPAENSAGGVHVKTDAGSDRNKRVDRNRHGDRKGRGGEDKRGKKNEFRENKFTNNPFAELLGKNKGRGLNRN